MNKKIFSILLSMILMVSMLAMPVFAEETGSSPIVKTETGNNEEPTDSNVGEKENNQVNNNDNVPQDAVDQQGDNNNQGNEGSGEPTTTEPETTDTVISQDPDPQSVEISLTVEGAEDSNGDGTFDIEINRGTEKTFTVKAEVTTDGSPVENAEVTFSSSDSDAVNVDAGEITVKSATEVEPAVITAEFEGSNEYLAASASLKVNVVEWIPSINKPSGLDDDHVKEAVIYRTTGGDETFDDLMIFEGEFADFIDENLETIKNGQMDVWHGYKYKKADNDITTSIDSNINEAGRYEVKYGSEKKDLEVKATGDVSSSSDNVAIEVTDGIISVIDKVSDIVKITIEAAGDEFTKAAKRTIDVEVVKGDQLITVDKDSYSVPFGTRNFNLGAKSNAGPEAKLEYSSNNAAVGVDSAGNVTIKNVTGSRAAVITIRSDATDRYNAAPDRTVSITVTSPSAPSLTAKAIGKRKVQLSWSGVTGAVSYQIQPYLGKKTLKAKTVTSTSIKNTKLKKRKTYKYKVRAVVTANGRTIYGPWSTLRSVKVK